MTVDVHPGKAVDQRAAGDLDLLEVTRASVRSVSAALSRDAPSAPSCSNRRRLEMVSK
jgi:hypothetical protein